jgi:hypothetical protein
LCILYLFLNFSDAALDSILMNINDINLLISSFPNDSDAICAVLLLSSLFSLRFDFLEFPRGVTEIDEGRTMDDRQVANPPSPVIWRDSVMEHLVWFLWLVLT